MKKKKLKEPTSDKASIRFSLACVKLQEAQKVMVPMRQESWLKTIVVSQREQNLNAIE